MDSQKGDHNFDHHPVEPRDSKRRSQKSPVTARASDLWAPGRSPLGCCDLYLRRTPHPVIVTIRENRDYIRVLLYSYYTTITGWGVLLIYTILGGSWDLVTRVISKVTIVIIAYSPN